MKRMVIFLILLPTLLLTFSSCEKAELEAKDSTKKIVSFSLKKSDGTALNATEVNIAILGDSIIITVPFLTDITQLIPEIEIKGLTISPASGVAQDFSNPLTYIVKAEDGSISTYKVIVKVDNPGGLVYIGSSDNNFYALDALSGDIKWKYASNASFAYSSATYDNGTVFVGGIDNYIYAFDAVNGSVKWKYLASTTGVESDAVVVNGTVYVGSNDDYLLALDANTGQLKWKFQTGSNVSSSPTVWNEVVYFGSSDGNLYALDAGSGQFKWSYSTGGMLNQSGPALVNGTVYVGSRDGYLYAVDAISGKLKWRFSANGISLEQSSPTVANGIVYIGAWYEIDGFSRKGSLYAVNAATGSLVWESLNNTGISSSPTVWNGRLYITADDLYLHALDANTGATLWKQLVLANSASPAVSNGVVFVGGGGTGHIYAFDAISGVEKWRLKTTGLMTSCPLIIAPKGKVDYAGDSGLMN